MMNSLKIIEENINLEVDFLKESVQGQVDFLIKLPINNLTTLTIELMAMQLNIERVSIANSPFVKFINFNYQSPEQQANFLSKLLPEPLSLDFYISYTNKLETQRNGLPDKIFINLQMTPSEESPPEEITFNLVIQYKLIKPLSGLIFLKNLRNGQLEEYLYSQNFHKSSKFWVPCFAENFIEEINISSFTIIVPNKFLALCSGKLTEIIDQEDHKKKAYVYHIDRKMQLEKIGLCVGIFTFISKESDFYIFSSKNIAKDSLSETMKIYEEMLIFVETFSKSNFFSNSFYKLVYLPNLTCHISESEPPLSYSGMCFCDEEYIIDPKSRETYLRNKRAIFQTVCWSMVNEIKVQSELQDKWILYGFNGFLADQFRGANENEQKIYLAEVFESFNKIVKEGKEIFPISCENQTRRLSDHEFDEIVRLKSRLVFHMITSIANCKKQIAKTLFSKQIVNTDYFLKTVKINFGIKKLKYFVKQFVKSTGIPSLEVSYNYSRKEKKIYFTFNQTPLQENYFKTRQKSRILLEEKKFGKPCEELSMLEKEHKLGVPDLSKSWRYFYGKLHIIVCETNEIDYKEESHQINLEKKPESKAMINCRAQFRKTVNKKIGDNDEEIGGGTSIMDYGYNATSSLYESKKKMSIFTFNNSARNPVLWIKIDSENEFFHDIAVKYEKISKSHNSEHFMLFTRVKG